MTFMSKLIKKIASFTAFNLKIISNFHLRESFIWYNKRTAVSWETSNLIKFQPYLAQRRKFLTWVSRTLKEKCINYILNK